MNSSETREQVEEVCLLLHGIRTTGDWQDSAKRILSVRPGLIIKPIKYKWFDPVRFLLPGPTRRRPIRRIQREIHAAQHRWPNASLSVIAHSFGTYSIGTILKEDPHLKLDKLLLCGSILPQDFHWDRLSRQVTGPIINDCGVRDIWPVMAGAVTWGYGASGTLGFGSALVEDRYHDFNHSDFFNLEFVAEYWKPLFEHKGALSIPEGGGERSRTPYWMSPLLEKAPIQYIVCLLLAVLVLGSSMRACNGEKSPSPEEHAREFRDSIKDLPYDESYAKGEEAYLNNEFMEALVYTNHCIDLNFGDHQARLLSARIYLGQKKYKEAAGELEFTLNLERETEFGLPQYPTMYLLYGCYLELEKAKDALKVIDQMITIATRANLTELAKLHYHRGVLLLNLREPEQAHEAWTESLDHSPAQVLEMDVLLMRAITHNLFGQSQEALNDFKNAEKLAPFSSQEMREKVTRNVPTKVEALLGLEQPRSALGVIDKALKELEEVEVIGERDAKIVLSLRGHKGLAYVLLGQVDEAIGYLRLQIDERPGFAHYWYNLAIAHTYKADWDAALSALETVVMLDKAWAYRVMSDKFFGPLRSAEPNRLKETLELD